MQHRRAFTLIELLVVVAIIVALLAILLPSLNKAIAIAQRTQCMSNLHQWGTGLLSYSADNFGKLMRSPKIHGGAVHPMVAFGFHNVHSPAHGGVPHGEFAADLIDPYVGGQIDFDNRVVPRDSIWHCPVSLSNGLSNEPFQNEPPLHVWNTNNYIHFSYQYFAGVKSWQSQATHPQDIAGSSVGDSRGSNVLMTDELWYQKGFRGWQYGHGSPPSAHRVEGGAGVLPIPDSLEGIARLTIDGSVRWKDASEFDINTMGATPGVGTPENHWVNNGVAATAY